MLPKIVIRILLALLTVHRFQIFCSDNEKFVIGVVGQGFFSCFNHTISNLLYADRHNKIPVVDFRLTGRFHGRFIYLQADGYNGSTNPWEYYFEPVSHLKYEPGDYIHRNYLTLDRCDIPINDPIAYEPDVRNSAHNCIKKYIKIKSNIQAKIDQFYSENMLNKVTIGIHLRGTDKMIEVLPINPNVILQTANEIAEEMGNDCQFFVATDEERLLTLAKSTLKGPVISYNSTRSLDGMPTHIDFDIINRALLGEEILIETKLLSLCDLLIHTLSHISQAACYFNPELKNILLTEDNSQRFNPIKKRWSAATELENS